MQSRFPGTVPTPYEIPPELLKEEKPAKSKRPLLISLIAGCQFITAGGYLLLALVPWGNPESGLASYLIAHKTAVFGLLPQLLQPLPRSEGAYIQALPYLFSMCAGVFAFAGWKLWNLDSWWFFAIRWYILFWSGSRVAAISIAVLTRHMGTPSHPLPAAEQLTLVVIVVLNLLLFGYFAFNPNAEKAYG